MTRTTTISSPGKVLIAGGYLVLDPNQQGFVISTPSRFYTVVQDTPDSTPSQSSAHSFKITVKSPQFLDGRWEYEATRQAGQDWSVAALPYPGCSPNAFVHLSLSSALLLATAVAPNHAHSDLDITIVGSNDFYSQSREDGATIIPFVALGTTIANVHKTGLGSSAAMVTSLTAALFLHLTSEHSRPAGTTALAAGDRALIHNLAQYVHSLAQGKVGSGFDVSAAVYGSQTYRRFAVECLGSLLSTKDATPPTAAALLQALSPEHNPMWKAPSTSAIVNPFNLPPSTTLILADVDAGSNTPSMVGGVMSWKGRDSTTADTIWAELKASNSQLAATFSKLDDLAENDEEVYAAEIEKLSKISSAQWDTKSEFSEARRHILTTRDRMRTMGELSSVAIEPPEQTKLLDAISASPGVIGAGVPGAGGYDAIWVLVLSPTKPSTPSPAEAVGDLLVGWKEMSVRPLSRTAWALGGTEQGARGLLIENLDQVAGLAKVVRSSS